ncbi:Metallo-dependent phosphatase-like protein [Crepidotus variabilis]|uniref:Metallo-dependent phosphatase-like protein n=1 Tax=Crepidotus variabilis TaxID=179855 RepID=A0A9P6EIM9_9AGAR|nr:Metallo-dependent phosphatase-like protein [Crepidotus variabilis]
MHLQHHFTRLALLLGLAFSSHYADACAHDDNHDHAERATPSVPLPPPTRPLVWGDVNIIHTTDSHGWLLGHQKKSFPEPNYSGDLGDFSSFVAHMKDIAIQKDVDILLVDTGDLHDGTGLVDGSPGSGFDAHDANEFFKQLPYDVLAIGNHELYKYNNTLNMHKYFTPHFQGRYLSSNANLTYSDEGGQAVNTPVGDRFAKFTTRKGRKVTALGVLFDFKDNAKGTTVQKVGDMVKESWFKAAIKDEPDFFLLAGHMPVIGDKWPLVFNAIRAIHPHTPILILGGHTHIRDCTQLDGRSMALESGRYMETVGWMSVNLDQRGSSADLAFSRRYLDPNRVTYEYHTKQSNQTFDTPNGLSITTGLKALAKKYGLDRLFGNVPKDYTINQAPYPGNGSLLSLFIEQALPFVLGLNNTLTSNLTTPSVVIVNSELQRFDIYAGPFTKDDQISASPFVDRFLHVPNVKLGIAKQVIRALNGAGENTKKLYRPQVLLEMERTTNARGEVNAAYRRWLKEMASRDQVEANARDLTLGYVTKDSCPGIGDDTPHTPLPYHDVPEYISSTPPPSLPDNATVDLVFVDFFVKNIVSVLNQLQRETIYTVDDAKLYSDVLSNEVWTIYARHKWN